MAPYAACPWLRWISEWIDAEARYTRAQEQLRDMGGKIKCEVRKSLAGDPWEDRLSDDRTRGYGLR